jgi:hypothetical protein
MIRLLRRFLPVLLWTAMLPAWAAATPVDVSSRTWASPAVQTVVNDAAGALDAQLAQAVKLLDANPRGAGQRLAYMRFIGERLSAEQPFLAGRDHLRNARQVLLTRGPLDFVYHLQPVYDALADLMGPAPEFAHRVTRLVEQADEAAGIGNRGRALALLTQATDRIVDAHAYLPLSDLERYIDSAQRALGRNDIAAARIAVGQARNLLAPLMARGTAPTPPPGPAPAQR